MHSSSRASLVVAMAVLIALFVSACSGSPGTATTSSGSPDTATTSSAPSDTPAAVQSASNSLADLAQAAKAESGEINTYGMPDTWANYGLTFSEFQKAYGISRSDIDMGSSVVLSRMTEENASKNDLADVLPTFAQQLAAAGLTDTYQVSCWNDLPGVEKGIGSNGSVWNSAHGGTIGWIVNTDLVKKVPKTWADLSDPTLKGMISYPDPRASGTGITIVEAASAGTGGDPFNYQSGVDLLANLKKVGNVAAVETKVDVSKYQRGEVGVLINFDYNLLQWKKDLGVASEVVIPTDGSVASGVSVIAAKNAPHPKTARLGLEFITCGPGQALYAASFVSPILSTVQLPADVAAQFPPKEEYAKVIRMDYTKAAEIKQAVIDAWTAAAGT